MASWTAFPAPPDRNPARVEEFPPELGGLSVLELSDASNECQHGSLPFDRDVECGCWNLGWKKATVTVLPERRPTRKREAA